MSTAVNSTACPTNSMTCASITDSIPPIAATNGAVYVVDAVMMPPWLPPADPVPPTPATERLMFYYIDKAAGRCGEVDATDAVPPTLFKSEAELQKYTTDVLLYWMAQAMYGHFDPDLQICLSSLGRFSDFSLIYFCRPRAQALDTDGTYR